MQKQQNISPIESSGQQMGCIQNNKAVKRQQIKPQECEGPVKKQTKLVKQNNEGNNQNQDSKKDQNGQLQKQIMKAQDAIEEKAYDNQNKNKVNQLGDLKGTQSKQEQLHTIVNQDHSHQNGNKLAKQSLSSQMKKKQTYPEIKISKEQEKQKMIDQNQEKLFSNLKQLRQKYKDSKVISAYLNFYQNSTLQDYFPANPTQQEIEAFQNQRVLGCRVILLLMVLTTETKYSRIKHNSPQLKQLLTLSQFKQAAQFFGTNKIQYSFKEYPWKIISDQAFPRHRYRSSYQQDLSINQAQQQRKLKQQSQSIDKIKNTPQFFNRIKTFISTIGLNPYQSETEASSLLKGLISLNGEQYKKRYILDIAQVSFQNLNNIKFYSGDLKIRNNRMNIQDLHQKHGDYQWLQQKHDYIQWMFPNHYQSSFNGSAQALSYFEAKFFQKDLNIGKQLLQSIQIYFDFAGIRISEDLQITMINRNRLKDVLIYHTHNHLRIMRILACLSVTGFRIIALNFVSFLQFVVQSDKDFRSIKDVFIRDWKVYDDNAIDSQGAKKDQGLILKKAKQMCFLADQYFPQVHPFLRTIYREKASHQQRKQYYQGAIKRQQSCFYQPNDITKHKSLTNQIAPQNKNFMLRFLELLINLFQKIIGNQNIGQSLQIQQPQTEKNKLNNQINKESEQKIQNLFQKQQAEQSLKQQEKQSTLLTNRKAIKEETVRHHAKLISKKQPQIEKK